MKTEIDEWVAYRRPDKFRAVLARVGYYQEARTRFGDQPWSMLERFTNHLG